MSKRLHKTAAVIAVGDEIVRGEKLDTNSAWISARLGDRGIEVVEHATADDDADAIGRMIRDKALRCDLVIVTGGLGPTADDLTRAGLALALGVSLVEDAEAFAQIEGWFERTGRPMPTLNRVQAQRPVSAVCLENHHGTAPGVHHVGSDDLGDVFCLPGPPGEMRPMFERFVEGALRPAPGHEVSVRLLHTIGIGESDAAQVLGELMDRERNPVVGTTASGGIVTCRLRYTGSGADELLDELGDEVRSRLGAYVFGSGAQTIHEAVLNLLRERSATMAVVESCTGGLLGSALTKVAGSSDVFAGGWITYSNEMKQAQLNVPKEVLNEHGAVSLECVDAMAIGGLRASGASCCTAITGIAGPEGGSDKRPVGTVWICVAQQTAGGEVALDARRFHYPAERTRVRQSTVVSALALIRLTLLGEDLPLLFEQEAHRGFRKAVDVISG